MIFKRKEYEFKHGNGDILYKIVIQSVPCPKTGHESEVVQSELLRQIVSTPDLVVCHGHPFQTLTFKYITDRWVIEAQALEQSQPLK